jgi:hypothetical protein
MLQEVFNKIREQYGFVTDIDVAELRKLLPNPSLRVLVRCGCDRFVCPLNELEHRMAEVEKKGDYVRDVSVPANPKPVDWNQLGYRHP